MTRFEKGSGRATAGEGRSPAVVSSLPGSSSMKNAENRDFEASFENTFLSTFAVLDCAALWSIVKVKSNIFSNSSSKTLNVNHHSFLEHILLSAEGKPLHFGFSLKKVTIFKDCQKMSSLLDNISPASFFYYSLICTTLANLWDIYLHYRQVLLCRSSTISLTFPFFLFSIKSTRRRVRCQLSWHPTLTKTISLNRDFTILTRATMVSSVNCLACYRNP